MEVEGKRIEYSEMKRVKKGEGNWKDQGKYRNGWRGLNF